MASSAEQLLGAVLEQARPFLCRSIAVHGPWLDWSLLAAIAAPHVLLAYVWLHPQAWVQLFGKQAVGALALITTFLKLVVWEVGALWILSTRPTGLCLDFTVIQLWQFLACLLLLAFGQALTREALRAVGVSGIFYGSKLLGKADKEPEPEEQQEEAKAAVFPFNVSSHPQYLGSVLSVWGVALLLFNQYPEHSQHRISVWLLSVYATILWALTTAIEVFL